ncbi:MAG: DUF4040 domain-containing protein [Sphaerochaetaceae bacterium]|nr:DUF4040 domain-containing protein [Sphaerochaetaceae bacterium]
MIESILFIVLALLALASAVVAVISKNLVTSIISAGLVSLLASLLYLLMSAPDVAMTEAAIGSSLATIIFFYVLNRIRAKEDSRD